MKVVTNKNEAVIHIDDVDFTKHYVVGKTKDGAVFFIAGDGYRTDRYSILSVCNYTCGNGYGSKAGAALKVWLVDKEVYAFWSAREAFAWLAENSKV